MRKGVPVCGFVPFGRSENSRPQVVARGAAIYKLGTDIKRGQYITAKRVPH